MGFQEGEGLELRLLFQAGAWTQQDCSSCDVHFFSFVLFPSNFPPLFYLYNAQRQRNPIQPVRLLNITQIWSYSQAAKVIAARGFNWMTVYIIKLLNRWKRANETVVVCPLDRWWLFNNLFSFFLSLFYPWAFIHRGRLLLPACYSIISIMFVDLFNGIKQANIRSIQVTPESIKNVNYVVNFVS